MLKKFALRAKKTISRALESANELGHTYIGSEHLLLGLVSEESGTVSQLLADRGCRSGDIRERIIGMVGVGCRTALTAEDMTPIFRRIILRASFIAKASGSSKVGSEHLLIAMLGEECVAVHILETIGVDITELLSYAESLYCESMFDTGCDQISCDDRENYCPDEPAVKPEPVPTPLLDANSYDMTARAREGRLDPVIGRESEEERLISILMRRTKNNPCLIGEAGVGKTAVVESLALRIAEGRVPDELKGKRIMNLELASLVAGTKYRGEFEEKVKNILDEARKAHDVIIFIDEIHTVVGAGGAEGAIDASNILKPALARGEIRLIGATTLREYKQSIEKDKALERRFQTVTVREPDKTACRNMLMGLKSEYERYHGVRITDSAINAAITLSSRYITDRRLPDKAIDLLDEASAARRTLCPKHGAVVEERDIAAAVEVRTGIPVSVLTAEDNRRLLDLETELKKHIIGQDEALCKLASAVRRARSGVRTDNRPGGTFLFIGGAGVGKTETARTLAETVFGGKNSFLRIDMSEYTEPHSVSKLIGAPAGYIGYGEGGILTERVRRDPYTLVLFDELEKAHPDIRALLLQILDEGVITDSSGIEVPFADSMVIATANIPKGASGIGFGAADKSGADIAAGYLPPELIDRFDDTIIFSDLDFEDLCSITKIKLAALADKLAIRDIKLTVSDETVKSMVTASKSHSARGVSRFALHAAEDAVSASLLSGVLAAGDEAEICFETAAEIKIIQKVY